MRTLPLWRHHFILRSPAVDIRIIVYWINFTILPYLALPSADDTLWEPEELAEYREPVIGREESAEYEEYPVGLDDSIGLE